MLFDPFERGININDIYLSIYYNTLVTIETKVTCYGKVNSFLRNSKTTTK